MAVASTRQDSADCTSWKSNVSSASCRRSLSRSSPGGRSGGHSLHVVCDMTLASAEHAIFAIDADVASFDAGYGSAYLARQVGQKRAREIFFLGRNYLLKKPLR